MEGMRAQVSRTRKRLTAHMRVLVDDDARARHVMKTLDQAQGQGKHRVACKMADELAGRLSTNTQI